MFEDRMRGRAQDLIGEGKMRVTLEGWVKAFPNSDSHRKSNKVYAPLTANMGKSKFFESAKSLLGPALEVQPGCAWMQCMCEPWLWGASLPHGVSYGTNEKPYGKLWIFTYGTTYVAAAKLQDLESFLGRRISTAEAAEWMASATKEDLGRFKVDAHIAMQAQCACTCTCTCERAR